MRRKTTLVSFWFFCAIVSMPSEPTKLYLDAVLRPNRSLSPAAFMIVMAIVGGVSFIAGMAFITIGAFPVIGFFGLDALLIWFAFRNSFRDLKQSTYVRVSAETVELLHERPGKPPVSASLPTAFTRIDLARPRRKPSELRLSFKDQTWVIGRFLTPAERRSFKDALDAAIRAARQERHTV